MQQYTFDPYKISGDESRIASDIINNLNSDKIKHLLTLQERQSSLIKQLFDEGFTWAKINEIYTNITLEERGE